MSSPMHVLWMGAADAAYSANLVANPTEAGPEGNPADSRFSGSPNPVLYNSGTSQYSTAIPTEWKDGFWWPVEPVSMIPV